MGAGPSRAAAGLLAGVLLLSPLVPEAAAGTPCSNGYSNRREVAHGRFLDSRWELSFFRDRRERPCLVDEWSAYAAVFPFEVREHRPRLAVLHLVSTSSPHGRSAYVIEGYVQERVARMTFRIDGRTQEVRIVRPPRWTRLRKDLFVHFVGTRRYDRGRTGRLRAYDADGRLLATRTLRRGQFFPKGQLD